MEFKTMEINGQNPAGHPSYGEAVSCAPALSALRSSAVLALGGGLALSQVRRERVAALGASVAHTAHNSVSTKAGRTVVWGTRVRGVAGLSIDTTNQKNTGLVADGGFPRVMSAVSGWRT